MATCEHCGRKFNQKMRYCPHCGGEHRKAAADGPPTCPRCQCSLVASDYRGSEIDLCPECGGLWMDTQEFAYHTSERDTFADDTIPRQCPRPPAQPKDGYVKCARCHAVMVRKNFRRISGVLIDICRDHGVWLDAGELEQIRCFIANGGLDTSQDKTIAENSVAIAKVASETKDLAMVFRTLNKFDLKRILLQGF